MAALPFLEGYLDAVAALPNELTRSFSDLRELDAVLRSSIEAITSKIVMLTKLIESETATPSERLVLLLEVADDAQRLRMGSEDKIRVSGKACEEIVHTHTIVNELLGQVTTIIPHFSETLSVRKTTYPHVAPSSLLPVTGEYASGRRKRLPPNTLNLMGINAASPAKKRKLEEEIAGPRGGLIGRAGKGNARATSQQQRKVNTDEGTYRSGVGPSPLSRVASNIKPKGNLQAANYNGQGGARRNANLLDAVASRGLGRTFDDDDYASGSPRNFNNDEAGSPAPSEHGSSRHPSVMPAHQQSSRAAANRGRQKVTSVAQEEYELEVNGYPDDSIVDGSVAAGDGTVIEEMDEAGDLDDRKYCYCNRVSFGEMIACDDDSCEREWFHLSCLGFMNPPKGHWYCAPCTEKREEAAAAASKRSRGNGARGGGAGSRKKGGGKGRATAASSVNAKPAADTPPPGASGDATPDVSGEALVPSVADLLGIAEQVLEPVIVEETPEVPVAVPVVEPVEVPLAPPELPLPMPA